MATYRCPGTTRSGARCKQKVPQPSTACGQCVPPSTNTLATVDMAKAATLPPDIDDMYRSRVVAGERLLAHAPAEQSPSDVVTGDGDADYQVKYAAHCVATERALFVDRPHIDGGQWGPAPATGLTPGQIEWRNDVFAAIHTCNVEELLRVPADVAAQKAKDDPNVASALRILAQDRNRAYALTGQTKLVTEDDILRDARRAYRSQHIQTAALESVLSNTRAAWARISDLQAAAQAGWAARQDALERLAEEAELSVGQQEKLADCLPDWQSEDASAVRRMLATICRIARNSDDPQSETITGLFDCLPEYDPDTGAQTADQLLDIPVEDNRYAALRAVQWMAGSAHHSHADQPFDWQSDRRMQALSQHADPAVRTMFVMALGTEPGNDPGLARYDVGENADVPGALPAIVAHTAIGDVPHRDAVCRAMHNDPAANVRQAVSALRIAALMPLETDYEEPDVLDGVPDHPDASLAAIDIALQDDPHPLVRNVWDSYYND